MCYTLLITISANANLLTGGQGAGLKMSGMWVFHRKYVRELRRSEVQHQKFALLTFVGSGFRVQGSGFRVQGNKIMKSRNKLKKCEAASHT